MAIRTPRRVATNVAIAQGEIRPNGVDISPANPDIQATVRPLGWMFRPSAGYPTVRTGPHRIDAAHPQGNSIHFTPLLLAEDLSKQGAATGPPAMVDVAKAGETADLANVPGSEYLDGEGKLPGYLAAGNYGPYLADSSGAPTSDGTIRHGGNVGRDMGDRDPERFLTVAWYDRLFRNPNMVLREDFRTDPVVTTIWAIVVVGGIGMLAGNLERAFKGRGGGRGVAATAGATPAVAASATTETAKDATVTVIKAAEESVKASETVVKEAEKAVEKTADVVTK